jgi:RNA polymerase sigma factor (sigma-70 family)
MSNQRRQATLAPAISESFDDIVVPHLDAGYRLAHWLTGNAHDAEDVVQEASLRALRYFRTFTGGNGRAWFLTIVRNTFCRWHSRSHAPVDTFDEEQHSRDSPGSDPESLLMHDDNVTLIERAMSTLSSRFRQLLVLRELQELSYRRSPMSWASRLEPSCPAYRAPRGAARRARQRAETVRHRKRTSPRRQDAEVACMKPYGIEDGAASTGRSVRFPQRIPSRVGLKRKGTERCSRRQRQF